NDNYYLNNVHESNSIFDEGIVHSDILSEMCGTFDTILIKGTLEAQSKYVLSTTERIDGHCIARLTIYTSGQMRANFMDVSRYCRLCINDNGKGLFIKEIV